MSTASNQRVFWSLVLAVIFWGSNNVGLKFLAHDWPPAMTASLRFILAGAALLGAMRWTSWLGSLTPLSPTQSRQLWWRGGVILAAFMVACNLAFRYLPASHFALYMAASPVWALLMEGGFSWTWRTARQFAAAGLAFAGVGVLLGPALRHGESSLLGEVLGLSCGLGWAIYSRQSRQLAESMSAVEVTARSMWRAGWLLLPFGIIECVLHPIHATPANLGVLVYCALVGAAVAYALWNQALTQWPSSRVFLFSNLIPLSTMAFAHLLLGEPLTSTFASAMGLILLGVILGVVDLGTWMGRWWSPEE
jgi:drug/metabolite transporter (DMT)-like permease